MALQAEAGHLLVRDLDTLWIFAGIDLGTDPQSGLGRGGGDEIDNHLVTHERFAAPVLTDEREQPMLNLVPLAGSGRQISSPVSSASFCNSNFQRRTLAPLLPPESARDQQFPALIGCGTHRFPPTP